MPIAFENLKERIISNITVNADKTEMIFEMKDGAKYKMFSMENEYSGNDVFVSIEDIVGDLKDLLNYPLTMAEVISNSGQEDDIYSFTWTYYKLATVKGYVTIRWYGKSNGEYSEKVNFEQI